MAGGWSCRGCRFLIRPGFNSSALLASAPQYPNVRVRGPWRNVGVLLRADVVTEHRHSPSPPKEPRTTGISTSKSRRYCVQDSHNTASSKTRQVAVLPKALSTSPHCGATEHDLATSSDHGSGMKSIAEISCDLNPSSFYLESSSEGRTPRTASNFISAGLDSSYTCVSTWAIELPYIAALRPKAL